MIEANYYKLLKYGRIESHPDNKGSEKFPQILVFNFKGTELLNRGITVVDVDDYPIHVNNSNAIEFQVTVRGLSEFSIGSERCIQFILDYHEGKICQPLKYKMEFNIYGSVADHQAVEKEEGSKLAKK